MTVITFGELLLRLSPPGEERLLESPVLHTCFGGAEANVAVALRHLGVPSSYITRLPESPLGEAGLGALQREGVTVDPLLRGGSRLGLYFVEPGADPRDMRRVDDPPGPASAHRALGAPGRRANRQPRGGARDARRRDEWRRARDRIGGPLRLPRGRHHAARDPTAPRARMERRAVRQRDARGRQIPW